MQHSEKQPLESASLQARFAPQSHCFGCGPRNERGLQIQSYPRGDRLVARWTPQKYHEAFDNMLSGGICGTLLDCHSNWAAAWHLMQANKLDKLPCTVTASFKVILVQPTPTDRPLQLTAWVVRSHEQQAIVEATLAPLDDSDAIEPGTITAKCTGTFVAVQPGHPGYHRW